MSLRRDLDPPPSSPSSSSSSPPPPPYWSADDDEDDEDDAAAAAPDDADDAEDEAFDAAGFQRRGHGIHVAVKALLGRQAGRDQHQQGWARGDRQQRPLHHQGDHDRQREQHDQRQHAIALASGKIVGFPVPCRVQPRYQPADPGHGVANTAIQPVRITEEALYDEGGESKKEHQR